MASQVPQLGDDRSRLWRKQSVLAADRSGCSLTLAEQQLAALKRTIWLTRPDLRASLDGHTEDFDLWLRVFGGREYKALLELPSSSDQVDRTWDAALPGVTPPLTDLMVGVWRLRGDLRARFDIRTADGQQALAWWIITYGSREWPELTTAAEQACSGLASALADEALPGVQPGLTRLMRLAWSMRRDLQLAFDLMTPSGQQDLAWWCFVHGPSELGLDRYITPAQQRFLNEPAEYVPQSAGLPVTRLMARIWSTRPDLQAAYSLDSHEGRVRFGGWFYAEAAKAMGLLGLLDAPLAEMLWRPAGTSIHVPVILSLLWVGDEIIRARFPNPNDPALVAWGESEGVDLCPVLRRIRDLRRPAGVAAPAITYTRRPARPGYNLIGYARGQFGIGEDVRMAALALRAAKVPYSIYNVEPGREVCQGDDSAVADLSDALPYSTNLFCTTGIETARLAAVEGGRLFDGRRRIGLWPWELPNWPSDWLHAYALVDEVWAASHFTFEAYSKTSPKPVRHMPMAVVTDASAGLTRRDFRLPARQFLFMFSFDALSGYKRKNPQGCIAAFRTAFPLGTEPVGLVIKVMRGQSKDPQWEEIKQAAKKDKRITIINKTLNRGATLDLCRACDCYLSLHRAEGFGRGIAEAMLLNRAVIATAWSGNMDYTTPSSAGLVSYDPIPVGPNEYPFGEGQIWADPDLEHAAWLMRKVHGNGIQNRTWASSSDRLNKLYGAATVGERYKRVLRNTTP